MFGDEIILGSKDVTIDNKYRIVIPSFTLAEENDLLVGRYIERNNYITIHALNIIKNKILEISRKQELCNSDKCDEYLRLKQRLDILFSECSNVVKLDRQKRFLIPDNLRNVLECDTTPRKLHVQGYMEESFPCIKVYRKII